MNRDGRLRAPFMYPGAKGKAAPVVWQALGNVAHYLEPFGGSAAVLLARPGGAGKYETLNDASAVVANAWRAIKLVPEQVLQYVQDPPSEVELAARGKVIRGWIKDGALAEWLIADPRNANPQVAGYWVWGQAAALGIDWLRANRPATTKPYKQGILGNEADPQAWLEALSKRLERVAIACGGWERLVTESALGFNNTGTTPTGIFLDPPYRDEAVDYVEMGGGETADVAAAVEAWCREHGGDRRLRIVLAGHAGDYELEGWRIVNWGGSRGHGRERRGDNECLWLSPHCEADRQRSLFG